MKSRSLIVLFLASAVFALFFNVTEAYAQSDGGKSYKEREATYLINRWSDNWYIGVAGGVQAMIGQNIDYVITPEVEINLTKWFTPSAGVRFGFQGINGKTHVAYYSPYQDAKHAPLPFQLDANGMWGSPETQHEVYSIAQADGTGGKPGTLHYGVFYLHGDLMWNVINSFKGYSQGRRFDLGVYAHAGLLDYYDPNHGMFGEYKDLEIGIGPGIIGTVHITNRLIATIDVRTSLMSTRFFRRDGSPAWQTSASLGIAYDINGRAWRQIRQEEENKAEAMSAYAEAQRRLREIEEENRHLMSKYQELEGAGSQNTLGDPNFNASQLDDVPEEAPVRVTYSSLHDKAEKAGLVIYYQINVDKINFSEHRHLVDYVRRTLAENPDQIFYITGSADKGTGNANINTRLSRNRANDVRNILINELGIKPENVKIRATIIPESSGDGELDRCVFIEED